MLRLIRRLVAFATASTLAVGVLACGGKEASHGGSGGSGGGGGAGGGAGPIVPIALFTVPLVSTDVGEMPRGSIGSLRVDAKNVYWSEQSTDTGISLDSCALDGCKSSTTVANNLAVTRDAIGGAPFATLGTDAFFAISDPSGNEVMVRCGLPACPAIQQCAPMGATCPKAVGTRLQNYVFGDEIYGVAALDGDVVWLVDLNVTTANLDQCQASGCPAMGPKTLSSKPESTNNGVAGPMVAGGSYLAWTVGSSVFACKPPNCAKPTVLATSNPPSNAFHWGTFAASSTTAYWIDLGNTLYACALSGCGGKPTTVAKHITAVVADDSATYYVVQEPAALMQCTGDCTAPTALNVMGFGQLDVLVLALDDQFVYWAQQPVGQGGDSIWKIPRP